MEKSYLGEEEEEHEKVGKRDGKTSKSFRDTGWNGIVNEEVEEEEEMGK